jgi:hypothetical protein
VDISRKILRQTKDDFLLFMASSEEERQKNEHLHASNDFLRHKLDCAQHAINGLEAQLYAVDGNESFVLPCSQNLPKLEDILRLVERLERKIIQLEESKLHMQVEHEMEMENVIRVYKGLLSEARPLPAAESMQPIEVDAESNLS